MNIVQIENFNAESKRTPYKCPNDKVLLTQANQPNDFSFNVLNSSRVKPA